MVTIKEALQLNFENCEKAFKEFDNAANLNRGKYAGLARNRSSLLAKVTKLIQEIINFQKTAERENLKSSTNFPNTFAYSESLFSGSHRTLIVFSIPAKGLLNELRLEFNVISAAESEGNEENIKQAEQAINIIIREINSKMADFLNSYKTAIIHLQRDKAQRQAA